MKKQQFNSELKTIVKPKGWVSQLFLKYILPLIWEYKDELLNLLFKARDKDKVQAFSGCQSPKPKNQITPNGSWECIGGSWVWVDNLG